jgi:hypothetical protein
MFLWRFPILGWRVMAPVLFTMSLMEVKCLRTAGWKFSSAALAPWSYITHSLAHSLTHLIAELFMENSLN